MKERKRTRSFPETTRFSKTCWPRTTGRSSAV